MSLATDYHYSPVGEGRSVITANNHSLGGLLRESLRSLIGNSSTHNPIDYNPQELRMAQGSKKIYHLEAYFAKLMSVIKNFTYIGLDDDMDF
jgi:hypothetical protein